jgi:hypothetical protein
MIVGKLAVALAGAEIDGIATPAAPPDMDGAATPMLAARIAVKLAITALFCMVADVFMSVETRTGSCDVPRNIPLRPLRPSDP